MLYNNFIKFKTKIQTTYYELVLKIIGQIVPFRLIIPS